MKTVIQGFIELHDAYDHTPVSIAISSILTVINKCVTSTAGIRVVDEDYYTIMDLIGEAL